MSILAFGNALIWLLILSVGTNAASVEVFGEELCWTMLTYYACYMMYDCMVSASLNEGSGIPATAIKLGKFAILLSIVGNTALLLNDIVFNFAYDKETSNASYYFLWRWIFSFVAIASTFAILFCLMLIVLAPDRS